MAHRQVGSLPFHRLSDDALRILIAQAEEVASRLESTSWEAGGEFRAIVEVGRSVLDERLRKRHPVAVFREGSGSSQAEREGWDIAALEADSCRDAAVPEAVKDFWTSCIHQLEDLQAEHLRLLKAGREGRWPELPPRFVIETYPPDDETFAAFVRDMAQSIGDIGGRPDLGVPQIRNGLRDRYPEAGFTVSDRAARPEKGLPKSVRLSVWRDEEHAAADR